MVVSAKEDWTLVRIEKRSGELEEFDVQKLEGSLTKAGANEENATRIAEMVAGHVTDGMRTTQLMMLVAREFRQTDPGAARRYETYKGSIYSHCPTCGRSMDTDFQSNAASCGSCGTVVQLPSKSISVPVVSQTDSSKKRLSVCMRCGARIRENERLCKNCSFPRPYEIRTIY